LAQNGKSTVAIIGAGIGGVYLLADIGLSGHKVRLHDVNDAPLAAIRARGGIEVEKPTGEESAPLELATTDLTRAVDSADIIIVCTGGNHQATSIPESSQGRRYSKAGRQM
jgi:ketopantoate reductase